jgi:hypothetical protein
MQFAQLAEGRSRVLERMVGNHDIRDLVLDLGRCPNDLNSPRAGGDRSRLVSFDADLPSTGQGAEQAAASTSEIDDGVTSLDVPRKFPPVERGPELRGDGLVLKICLTQLASVMPTNPRFACHFVTYTSLAEAASILQ